MNTLFTNLQYNVNKIFNMSESLFRNIPEDILRYIYATKGVDLEGGYYKFNINNVQVYMVKSNAAYGTTTMLVDNAISIVCIIPECIRYNIEDYLMAKSIHELYSCILKHIKTSHDNEFNQLCDLAVDILTIFTVRDKLQNDISVEDFLTKMINSNLNPQLVEKCLLLDLDALLNYGGIFAIMNEECENQ